MHFTVDSEPQGAEHILTKDGKAVTKRFMIQSNSIKFKKVRLEDSGTYTISCYSSAVLVCEDTIELEVIPIATSNIGAAATTQQSQGEQFFELQLANSSYMLIS